MTPTKLDKDRAKNNPWGMTAYQCMVLRLICEYGCTKRVNYDEERANQRTVEHHLMVARKCMKLFGNDVRLYLQWDRWTRKEKANDQETT
jgi:hypothetical protein